MKVPEKILITQDEDTKELSEHWCLRNLTNNPHIEYINKDGFIDKACQWLEDNKDHPFIECEDHQLAGFLTNEFIEEFKKYMKEE